MVTVMKNRTTDVNRFFSDLVDFSIYVVRSGGATIFLSDFASGPAKHAEFTAILLFGCLSPREESFGLAARTSR
jgi:hypothetical protein